MPAILGTPLLITTLLVKITTLLDVTLDRPIRRAIVRIITFSVRLPASATTFLII